MRTCSCALPAFLCALAGQTRAQSFTNGGFEVEGLAGWTVVNTANGVGGPGIPANIDMDGAGPLPPSVAAGFGVGQAVPVAGAQEGVEITQLLMLHTGTAYSIGLDWQVRQSAGSNSQGGLFAIIVGGQVVASANAGPTVGSTPISGHLSAVHTPAASGAVRVGVRITRPYTAAATLRQHVDNLTLGGGFVGCYANCDGSTGSPMLNVADFTCFLQGYAAGEGYANCDGSTVAPALTVQDFTCFLQDYAAGCG